MSAILHDMEDWLRYFETNAHRTDDAPWERDVPLTAEERRAILRSIAIFQLGESSEGRNLLRFAKEWGDRHHEPLLFPITRYFIREEQRHAALLGRFMQRHGIPLIAKNWTDRVFRHLRKTGRLRALDPCARRRGDPRARLLSRLARGHSFSRAPRDLRAIVEEERAHVRYQVERIRASQSLRSDPVVALIRFAHRVLYAGTVLVVYPEHRRVLRRGGLGLTAFWVRSWEVMNGAFAPQESSGTTRPVSGCGAQELGMGAMSSVKGPASSS